jgi:Replication protein
MTRKTNEAPSVSPDEASDEASTLHARIDRYGKAKERATDMVAHLMSLPQDPNVQPGSRLQPAVLCELVGQCGNWLKFRNYFTVGKVRLTAASFCKEHLLCPLCAIRRGAKYLKAYADRWTVLKAASPDLQLYLVTLTVVNGEDLAERFEHLRSAFQLLLHRRKVTRAKSALRAVSGGVASFEVTNKGNGWHPHVHMLVASRTPIDRQHLESEWFGITADSFIVDVRPIDQAKDDGALGGFCEVFKYAVKFSDLELADNFHAFRTLRGRRLLTSFGCFRGVEVPEELTDEKLELLPYVEMLYNFSFRARAYTVVTVSQPIFPQPPDAEGVEGPQAPSPSP